MTSAVSVQSEHASLRERIDALITALAQGGRDDAARDALLGDVIRHQAERVEPYRRWLETRSRGANPLDWPALPTDAFRYARVAGFPQEEQQREFLTSGTTHGTRGRHSFRSLDLYDHAARTAAAYALFFDGERQLIVLGPSEHEAPDSSLTYMLSRFADWFGIGPARYAWRDGRVDVSRLQRAIRDATQPVALLGTSFAWVHALDALPEALPTPAGSWVMQTGGFKGRSREVAPARLRHEIAARFEMSESSVVAEYGMTELSSQLYELTRRSPDAPRRYWVPGWARVTVVDADTLSPVPEGTVGLLRIDDLANLDSVAAIQTSDLARRLDGAVELVGRAAEAPPRGCSLAVEEALTS